MNTEVEFKFEHQSNLQFKFIQSEKIEDIFRKLKVICDLIGIKYGSYTTKSHTDLYFDDEISSLKKSMCTFRKRIITKNEFLITIKHDPQNDHFGGMERLEYEFSVSERELQNLITNKNNEIENLFFTKFGIKLECGKLENTLTIVNERSKIPLETDVAEYSFCYDKYYYFHKKERKYSEYFYEIEVELESTTLIDDFKINKLTNSCGVLLGFNKNRTSKYERGLNLERSISVLENIYCVCFDIIGYSKRTGDSQKQMIQAFNKITKEAINKYQGDNASRDVVYLPTGDGMIIVFRAYSETIIPIIFSIQIEVGKYNEQHPNYKFEFRTGIHAGPVFKYSDVNGNLNFAGSGINLSQRVMNIGDEWHILSSREAYEHLGQTSREFDKYFHSIGKYSVKHQLDLDIYNVYDREEQIGNMQHPTSA